MATASIGGIDITTYGLRLGRLDGNIDMPSFKRIIDIHDFEENLRVLDEQDVEIRLIGIYGSRSELGTKINQFYSQIQTAIKQQWIFSNHGFTATCVVKDQVNCQIYDDVAELTMKLTITE
jgi:hypothetical protein